MLRQVAAGADDGGARPVRVVSDDPSDVMEQLGLRPGFPVLVVVGGAGELDKNGKDENGKDQNEKVQNEKVQNEKVQNEKGKPTAEDAPQRGEWRQNILTA